MSAEAVVGGWCSVLADLEDQVRRIRRDLASPGSAQQPPPDPAPWEPPVGLGPLPAELEPRANTLMQGIAEVRDLTQRRQRDVGRQIAAVRSVPRPHAGTASVYVDVTG